MTCVITKNCTTKVPDNRDIPKNNNVLASSTFSHMSITRKNWTNSTIPAGRNAQLSSFGGKTLINLDTLYLKISEGILPQLFFASDGLHELSDHYHLEILPFGGRQYQYKATVYYSGDQIGTLLWGARLPSLAGTAKYEIDNVQLYDTINMDVWPELIIDNLLKLIESEVLDVFRADIAMDGEKIIEFMEAARDRIITPVRQSSYTRHDMRTDPVTGAVKGFAFGSRSSGRFVRVYDKTRELADQHKDGKKDYIKQFWIANNLVKGPTLPRVGRLEVELHRKFLLTVKDFHYTDLFNRAKLARLAQVSLTSWFDWVPTDSTDTKLNRRVRVEIINFSKVKTTGYARQRPEKGKSTRTEKIMVKRLILDACKVENEPERINYLQTAANICDKALLRPWLLMKSADIKTEIVRRSRLDLSVPPDDVLSKCLADLIAEVNESFRPLAVADSFGVAAGEIVGA